MTAHGHSACPAPANAADRRPGTAAAAVSTSLVLTLALQSVGAAVRDRHAHAGLFRGVTFIFGNASALAADQARNVAGAASAVLGVAQAVAMSVAAPLASSGGSLTAVRYDLGDDRRYHRLAARVPRPCPARRISRAFRPGRKTLIKIGTAPMPRAHERTTTCPDHSCRR